MVHVLASGIWSGGLFYLAAFAPREAGRDGLEGFRFLYVLIERFSTAALIAVGAVVATGAFATYLHVYDGNAVVSTPYGRSLAVKIGLFLAGVGAAGYNLMVAAAGPSARAGAAGPRRPGRGRRQVRRRREAGSRGGGGRLDRRRRPHHAAPGGHAGDCPGRDLGALGPRDHHHSGARPADEPGGLFISVLVQRDDGEPAGDGARMELLLEMTSHRMAVGPLVPQRVAPGRYEAETCLPMDGEWRMTVRVEEPGQETRGDAVPFRCRRRVDDVRASAPPGTLRRGAHPGAAVRDGPGPGPAGAGNLGGGRRAPPPLRPERHPLGPRHDGPGRLPPAQHHPHRLHPHVLRAQPGPVHAGSRPAGRRHLRAALRHVPRPRREATAFSPHPSTRPRRTSPPITWTTIPTATSFGGSPTASSRRPCRLWGTCSARRSAGR